MQDDTNNAVNVNVKVVLIVYAYFAMHTNCSTFAIGLTILQMEAKNITVRIPADMYEEMASKEKSISQQLAELSKKDKLIKRLSEIELRGKFTTKEWMTIADAMNGIMVEGASRYNQSLLRIEVEDKALYEGLEEKHGVNIRNLSEKIGTLTAAQTYALIERIEDFWSHDGVDSSFFEKI